MGFAKQVSSLYQREQAGARVHWTHFLLQDEQEQGREASGASSFLLPPSRSLIYEIKIQGIKMELDLIYSEGLSDAESGYNCSHEESQEH